MVNQGATPEQVKDIVTSTVNEIEKYRCNESSATMNDKISQKKKWFRADTGKEVRPNDLIRYGNCVAQFDGSITRAEMVLSNNKSVYFEFDIDREQISNIVAEGFPQEYSINVPCSLVVDDRSYVCEIGGQPYNVKQYQLKFGGSLMAVYDATGNSLQDIQAKAPAGMKVHLNPVKKEITFVAGESLK